jgi:diguanylate cyclase (GGDEF)-like protein
MKRRRRTDRSRWLYVYTATTIVVGALVVAWAVQAFPITPAISLTESGGREGILLGLVFWIIIGLLGSTRVERLRGHGVLTFHLPFIIAASALGGPAAGALVALISTIERRELRSVPWYGLLANHASLAIAAVAGGIVMEAAPTALAAFVPATGQGVEVVAIAAGSLVMGVVSTALAAGTVILRDRLTIGEAVHVYDAGFRATASAEVVLGWMLWLTYTTVGWWAALITAALVLVVWAGHDARESARHDAMTGLLTRGSFDVRLAEAIESVRRRGVPAALLSIDLDGFKAINDKHGHAAGDAVIREVGARLRASIRLTDSAVRRGGDEFGVLLLDIDDHDVAVRQSERILEVLTKPIRLDDRTVKVGASIGVFVIEPLDRMPTIDRLHDLADRLMYKAKRRGGGLRVHPSES